MRRASVVGKLPVTRRRCPHEPPEVTRELRLIVEANEGHVGRSHAAKEQCLRACDAEVRQIRVRWHSDLRTKGAAQVELIEVCVVSEIVEPDRVAEPFAEVLHRASDGS